MVNPGTLPANPSYGFPTFNAELVRWNHHGVTDYSQYNVAVWRMMHHIFQGVSGWNWISSFAQSQNGCGTLIAVNRHYLGDSYHEKIRSAADRIIDSVFFDGWTRIFTFERFCERLQGTFTDLAATGEIVSQERQVQVLLQGITDPLLQTAKAQVLATPGLSATFESTLNFISQFADCTDSVLHGARSVSAFQVGTGRGRGRLGRNPRCG